MPSLPTSYGYYDTRTIPYNPRTYAQVPAAANGKGTGVADSCLSVDMLATAPNHAHVAGAGGEPGHESLTYDLSVRRPPSPFRTSPGPSQGRFWPGGL